MSWSHVKSALESDLQGLDKLVLIVLANHCNDQDGNPKRGLAWPSVTTLVKEAGISRATVNRVLNRLEAGGYLAREHHGTRSTHYRLSVSEGDINARARNVNVSQGDINAIVSQTETEVSHSETPSVSERDIKLLKNPVRRESSPQRELSSSSSALGSEQSNPTRASRISALAPGNGGESVPADNEENPCNSFEVLEAEVSHVTTRSNGTGHKWSSQENRRSRLVAFGEPPEEVRAMSDSQVNVTLAWHMGQEESEKNGRRPSDVLTSDSGDVAPCRGP